MNLIQRWFFFSVAAALLLFSASSANATVFSLNGTFNVSLVRGVDLTGLVSEGDTVFVEAFYDTDLAVRGSDIPTNGGGVGGSVSYSFPAGGVGVRYTVNDLMWEAVGPLTVTVTPIEQILFNSDGSVAATYGGPGWE